MDTREAAQRWADVWERGWREHDADAITALYADGALWQQHPFREPEPGYLARVFAEEESAECQFGRPIVDGDQAAVPWSAQTKLVDGGTEDLAGVSLLRFDASGLVLEHFLSGARRSAARRTAAGSAAAPMRLLHLSMLTRNRPQRQQGRYAALWHSWLRHA